MDFMEAAIDWILINQQIPETLPGAALWRHMGTQADGALWRHTSTMAALL